MDKGSYDTNQFSAEDIQRYHAGQMSSQEKHAIEKAALDDSFLSDAMDGYANTSTAKEDIEAIKTKLFGRETDAKVIPITYKKRSFFSPVKVVVIVLVLAGAVWLFFQNTLPENKMLSKNISKTNKSDTGLLAPLAYEADSQSTHTDVAIKENKEATPATTKPYKKIQQPTVKSASPHSVTTEQTKPIADIKEDIAQKKTDEETKVVGYTIDTAKQNIQVATADIPLIKAEIDSQKMLSRSTGIKLSANAKRGNSGNIYTGIIADFSGYPIPFATITVVDKRKAVTTDVSGKFSLTTTDTMLLANVSSVGYYPFTLKITDPTETYKVILHPSRNTLTEVVVTAIGTSEGPYEEQKERFKKPVIGLINYNTYLENNIRQIRDKENNIVKGQVELLFDVNEKGEPFNIEVVRSIYPVCDGEALRLLKEGPKWRHRGYKKGQLIVNF